MHALSGVFPLPVALWLTFPDLGILTSEQLGAARAFILDRVKPGYFNEKEMDGLRTFYPDDGDEIMERMVPKPG